MIHMRGAPARDRSARLWRSRPSRTIMRRRQREQNVPYSAQPIDADGPGRQASLQVTPGNRQRLRGRILIEETLPNRPLLEGILVRLVEIAVAAEGDTLRIERLIALIYHDEDAVVLRTSEKGISVLLAIRPPEFGIVAAMECSVAPADRNQIVTPVE